MLRGQYCIINWHSGSVQLTQPLKHAHTWPLTFSWEQISSAWPVLSVCSCTGLFSHTHSTEDSKNKRTESISKVRFTYFCLNIRPARKTASSSSVNIPNSPIKKVNKVDNMFLLLSLLGNTSCFTV